MKPVAVITGATSGIGKAYAHLLAKQGYNLIITGRREPLLRDTANFLSKAYGCQVTICLVDFSNTDAFERFLKWIKTIDGIQMLINNAGYGNTKSFMKDQYEHQFDMMKVHIHASIQLAHCIGKKMKEQKYGAIINVCSLAAYIPLPTSAMYASTKSFLVTFSESLHMELSPYGVKVQALCPGFVHTDFHSKLDVSSKVLKSRGLIRFMKPKKVIKISLKALQHKDHVIVIPGVCNQVGYLLLKCMPKKAYYPAVRIGSKLFRGKIHQDE